MVGVSKEGGGGIGMGRWWIESNCTCDKMCMYMGREAVGMKEREGVGVGI